MQKSYNIKKKSEDRKRVAGAVTFNPESMMPVIMRTTRHQLQSPMKDKEAEISKGEDPGLRGERQLSMLKLGMRYAMPIGFVIPILL